MKEIASLLERNLNMEASFLACTNRMLKFEHEVFDNCVNFNLQSKKVGIIFSHI